MLPGLVGFASRAPARWNCGEHSILLGSVRLEIVARKGRAVGAGLGVGVLRLRAAPFAQDDGVGGLEVGNTGVSPLRRVAPSVEMTGFDGGAGEADSLRE